MYIRASDLFPVRNTRETHNTRHAEEVGEDDAWNEARDMEIVGGLGGELEHGQETVELVRGGRDYMAAACRGARGSD